MLTLTQLLQRTVEEGASDLIVKTGSVSSLRVRGHVEPIDAETLGEDQAMIYLGEMFDEREMQRYINGDEVDLAYELVGLGRFRVRPDVRDARRCVARNGIDARLATPAEQHDRHQPWAQAPLDRVGRRHTSSTSLPTLPPE